MLFLLRAPLPLKQEGHNQYILAAFLAVARQNLLMVFDLLFRLMMLAVAQPLGPSRLFGYTTRFDDAGLIGNSR